MAEVSGRDAAALTFYEERDDPARPYQNLAKNVILTAIQDYQKGIDKASCRRFLCSQSIWHQLCDIRPLTREMLESMDMKITKLSRSDG